MLVLTNRWNHPAEAPLYVAILSYSSRAIFWVCFVSSAGLSWKIVNYNAQEMPVPLVFQMHMMSFGKRMGFWNNYFGHMQMIVKSPLFLFSSLNCCHSNPVLWRGIFYPTYHLHPANIQILSIFKRKALICCHPALMWSKLGHQQHVLAMKHIWLCEPPLTKQSIFMLLNDNALGGLEKKFFFFCISTSRFLSTSISMFYRVLYMTVVYWWKISNWPDDCIKDCTD